MAMTLVSTVTLGTAASSIQFTGIPATGKDLLIITSLRSELNDGRVFDTTQLLINNDAGTKTTRALRGDGSSVVSFTVTINQGAVAATQSSTSNTFSNDTVYIANYTAVSNHSISVDSVNENNATSAFQYLSAQRDGQTTAITSLSFSPTQSTNFVAGSTASLYIIS